MQLKRLEFGFTRIAGKIAWKEPEFRFTKAWCGCYILDCWFFFFTYLNDECYKACKDPECECHKD